MNRITKGIGDFLFFIFTVILKMIALLPFRILYILSDLVSFLTYHVIRYRRKVVRDNLTKCFPDKSHKQIKIIEKRFYRNFIDYIFETVKLLHISDEEMCRRMTFNNVEAMDNTIGAGKDEVIYFSHTGNWEWATSVKLHSQYASDKNVEFGQIYRPLRNKRFDSLMLKLRDRFKTVCISKSTALRQLVRYRKENKIFVVGFMSDQKPSHGDPTRIVNFFGLPTAVISGTETLARRLNTAVFYWDITKPSRGHYCITVVPLTSAAANEPEGSLTSRYFELLQNTISRQPDLWLWTHKRWKNSPRSWDDVNPENLLIK